MPWWVATSLAFCLALDVALLQVGSAEAQLRDPPTGWDVWDPGWTQRDLWAPEDMDDTMGWRLTRHSAFIRDGVPAPYRGEHNPLTRTPRTVREGGHLYLEHCARCHDPAGMGGGRGGLALYPSPALLAQLIRMPDAVDGYLLWAISEGGSPFGTSMPAFESTLDREQIWQIVTYMRAGFPSLDGE